MKRLLFILFWAIYFAGLAQPTWVVSGAPIGDKSKYLYPVGGITAGDVLGMYAIAGEDSLEVFNIAGNPEGIHIYAVTKEPNTLCDFGGVNDRYFGVFIASASGGTYSYDVRYFYGGNPYVDFNRETCLRIFQRPTNADTACTAWNAVGGIIDSVVTLSITSGRFGGTVTLWEEDFGEATGCGDGTQVGTGYTTFNGTWTEQSTGAQGTSANTWYYGADEKGVGAGNCGEACSGATTPLSRSLFVASPTLYAFGFSGAVYDAGGFLGDATTDKRIVSPPINLTGRTGVGLFFDYIENGDGTNDNMTYEYSIDGGVTWNPLGDPVKTVSCGAQHTWRQEVITLPAATDNQPDVRIGFRWVNNNDGAGTDPSTAIDNVLLRKDLGARQEFILGSSCPSFILPVREFALTGKNLGNTNILQWKFIGNEPMKNFVVFRSEDGKNYQPVGEIPYSENQIAYSFYDAPLSALRHFYKITAMNLSGKTFVSNQIELNKSLKSEVICFPNPVQENLRIFYSGQAEDIKVEIFNLQGQKLMEKHFANARKIVLNVAELASGSYLVKLVASSGIIQNTLITKK